jgi:hypothetical protein
MAEVADQGMVMLEVGKEISASVVIRLDVLKSQQMS